MSVLFLLVAFYVPGYLELRPDRDNRVFCAVLLFFLAMTSLLALAQHLGLLWVAMEATTLATAPLLYFNRTARSLEATWKYLMIGSVGIAIALLGSLFLAYSAYLGGGEPSLLFEDLLAGAGSFSRPWLRAAFVLLLVGYGTKMGLAPLHTWKPDAYGEAPGLVGALLAGGMTNCAFLALLRVYRVVNAAGEGAFARELLVFMGLASIGLAAVFVVRQRDIKRMLAYSSVEHVGHPGPRDRPRRDRRLRRAPPRDQQRPDEGNPLPLGREHPPRLREQEHRRDLGRHLAPPRSREASSSSASSRSRAPRRSGRSSASSPS